VPAKWQTLAITPFLIFALGWVGNVAWAGKKDSAAAVRASVEEVKTDLDVLKGETAQLKVGQAADAARAEEASKRFDDLARRFDSLEAANLEVLKELRRARRDTGAGGTR
jgi:hypothetical protein